VGRWLAVSDHYESAIAMDDSTRALIARQALQALESLQGAGVLQLPKPQARPVGKILAAPTGVSDVRVTVSEAEILPEASTSQALKSEATTALFEVEESVVGEKISTASTLEILRTEVAGCTLCHELATTRTQTVFGVGNPTARLCFLGEAPGADEDRQGEPFVGRGGQLLNKIIEACRLKREDVYILNILKCRPPGNRNPTPGEADNCRHYLLRQLDLIQPEFICCLGAVAAQNLLRTTDAIGKLRGKVHDYRGISVVCTYHPAYLLRNPSAKKYTWDDMKMLMREMGQPVD
jgi:uracil-DNA glycosylase family 4